MIKSVKSIKPTSVADERHEKPSHIDAGYHLYGYWVEAATPEGAVSREEYGNSPHCSTSVFRLDGKYPVSSLGQIKQYAHLSAMTLAHKLKITDVSLFHDTECEDNIRANFYDGKIKLVA